MNVIEGGEEKELNITNIMYGIYIYIYSKEIYFY